MEKDKSGRRERSEEELLEAAKELAERLEIPFEVALESVMAIEQARLEANKVDPEALVSDLEKKDR